MAAGIDTKRLNARLRYRLNKLAREVNEYSTVERAYYYAYEVHGITADGKKFRLWYGVSRASNGETAALLYGVHQDRKEILAGEQVLKLVKG